MRIPLTLFILLIVLSPMVVARAVTIKLEEMYQTSGGGCCPSGTVDFGQGKLVIFDRVEVQVHFFHHHNCGSDSIGYVLSSQGTDVFSTGYYGGVYGCGTFDFTFALGDTIADTFRYGGYIGSQSPGYAYLNVVLDPPAFISRGLLKDDGAKSFGAVNEHLDPSPASNRFRATTSDPEVLVWVGDDPAQPLGTAADQHVMACIDSNQNKVCDADEGASVACENAGGDWYNGKCCGTDYTSCQYVGGITTVNTIYVKRDSAQNIGSIRTTPTYWYTATPGKPLYVKRDYTNKISSLRSSSLGGYQELTANTIYVKEATSFQLAALLVEESPVPDYTPIVLVTVTGINAFCGKNNEDKWEWAPLTDRGEIHPLTRCTDWGSVLSDGATFSHCHPTKQLENAQQFDKFKGVTSDGVTHEYYCVSSQVYECQGSKGAFSSRNTLATGAVTPGGSLDCPEGIVGYWKLDGNLNDAIWGNSGNPVNIGFGTGKVNDAATFGGNARVEVADTVVLNPSQLTIEAWVNPTTTQGTHIIVNKGNAYELLIQDGILKGAIQLVGGPLWSRKGTQQIPANQWSHVAMVFNGQQLTFYLNGVAAGFPLTGSIASSGEGLFIGDRKGIDYPSQSPDAWSGSIDEVAVYDTPLLPATITAHAAGPLPPVYCTAPPAPEIYYCASDGDWTKDLDVKDRESCDAAGFTGTGKRCCSEADDVEEYYNDPLAVVEEINAVIDAASGEEIIDQKIVLDQGGDWVRLKGPVSVLVDVESERQISEGVFELCKTFDPVYVDIPAGETKYVYNGEPAAEDPAGYTPPCVLRNTDVRLLKTPARGGCWNKQFIDSGYFAVPDRVINYHGQFYGCNIPQGNPLLQIKDTHLDSKLIDNSVETCGYVLENAVGGQFPHVYCDASGVWKFTDELKGTINKSIAWTGLMAEQPGIAATGCCKDTQCWNGSKCQSLGSYYRILDEGFVCKI